MQKRGNSVSSADSSENIQVKGNRMINLAKDSSYASNSKEKKELRNTEILCRTASSSKETSDNSGSNDAITNNISSTSINKSSAVGASEFSDSSSKLHQDCIDTTEERSTAQDITNATVNISNTGSADVVNAGDASNSEEKAQPPPDCDDLPDTDGISKNVPQVSVRTKNLQGSRKDFAAKRAEVQSVEIEEEKIDPPTPVYEDMDPAQALLSQHRLAAYLASPDCPPQTTLGESSQSSPALGEGAAGGTEQADCGVEGLRLGEPLVLGRCGPELAEAALQSAGTVTRLANNTVAFVADDLNHKIKLSSPSSAGASYPGSGASTPRFGNYSSQQHSHPHHQYHPHHQQSMATPSHLYGGGRPPPLDPALLNDIERHARRLATNVDGLIESLTDALHGISALTVDCVETYRDTVCKTCDAVDANIKSMYQLMAKGEELSKSMKPVYALHSQIKDVRRTLDILDSEMHSSGS